MSWTMPVLLSLCALPGCSASNSSDEYHTLRVEFRMFATATSELMDKEIAGKKDWRGDVKRIIEVIKKDEYWNKQLSDGEIFTSGGKDIWSNPISVYRRDGGGARWVIVESAGPDGDMATQEDNISARFALPS